MDTDKYMEHVGDLEEWNEDAGFVWGSPTVTFTESGAVVVVHPHTLPVGLNDGGYRHCTIVAVYTETGDRLALHVYDGRECGQHNYWGK